jgi:2-oxoglutarate dehydrogenase E1 component
MGKSITNAFNDAYAAEAYEAYRRDPNSVDESWRQYFRFAEGLGAGGQAGAVDPELARKAAGAAGLMYAIRTYGYLAVQLDPLGSPPTNAAELSPEFHGITEAELASVPGAALGFPHMATAADVITRLRYRYTRNLAIEYTHLSDENERQWFRELLTAERLTQPLTNEQKRALLARLTQVDGLERFVARSYVGLKRFSIEGTDALVPMLDAVISETATAGAKEIVIAMAHRGRLNVLTNVMGKPYAELFTEFEGRHAHMGDASTGDVKYHLGYEGEMTTLDGHRVNIHLAANPSHLEIINPVGMGIARALQRRDGGTETTSVIPICVHGDSAFPGEGIVPETFNLSSLRAYNVGGTVNIIVNNQVGFTTEPQDARSTHFASDVAKGFEIPIIHVNADDPQSCVIAMRIAIAYRQTFCKDFLVDLVGYRRHGHNEGDEPTYTQPTLYDRIKKHQTVRQLWAEQLVREGIVTPADVEKLDQDFSAQLQGILDEVRAEKPHETTATHPAVAPPPSLETGVAEETLISHNERMLHWPADFHPHPRLAKQLTRRRDSIREPKSIDWGHAEALAFASLLGEGTRVRMSGQDAERGTFSHRHAVLHDVQSGSTFTPLAGIGRFEVYNSPLSELGVMGSSMDSR